MYNYVNEGSGLNASLIAENVFSIVSEVHTNKLSRLCKGSVDRMYLFYLV